jgi:Secretion system C-terminal sorting domain
MKNKITLKSLLTMLVSFSYYLSDAQIYNNGAISTGATHVATNTAAPAGYTWSELEGPGTTLGSGGMYNTALTTDFSLADDFVVPTGATWNITNINVFGYQTGYVGATVPIDVLRIRIWNGDPSLLGSTVVAGDLTTNVLNTSGSGEEFIYRVANTTGTTRKVWRFNGNIITTLTAGTYWVEYQAHATNDANIFVPPVTILGTQTSPSWNAKQRNGATWAALLDGTSAKAIAFKIFGTTTLGINSNELSTNFKTYPNPIKGICNFKLDSKLDLYPDKVEVFDLKGTKIFEQKIIINNLDFLVDLSNLNSGTYLVKIKDINEKYIYSNKLIKE